MTLIKIICLALPILFTTIGNATEHNNWQLKRLTTDEKHDVLAQPNVASIVMFFQPNCPWCKKQAKSLAKLQQYCSEQLNIALIGHRAKRSELKRALKHFSHTLPAYMANRQLLRQIGGIAASPTTLVLDASGQLIAKHRGYIKPNALYQAAAVVSNKACQLSPAAR